MVDETSTSWFFAYGGKPSLRADTMRGAVKGIRKGGGNARTWEDLRIKGGILIDSITSAIDEHAGLMAEVSDLNPNVLFEAGYAIARGKHVWLAFDETDEEAAKNWKELGILSTVGRVNYSASSDSLASQCIAEDPERVGSSPLLERLLAGGKSRQPEAVFAPSLPSRIQPAISLEAFLERQSHLQLLGAGDDLGMAPLEFYVQEIYRSSAAVFHLLAERRVRAREHNARASLMAGIAHGFELPVLMVVEDGFESPLDYRDLLYSYRSTAELIEHVRGWLETLPKQAGTNRRLGRLALDIELPIRSFGQFVAEYEREELTDYFVETSEFRSILAGDAKVFVGRKGTGKTATMSQAVDELRRDRRNLVVSVKPSAYELASLIELVNRLGAGGHSEYLMVSLWSYLLHTEIAVRAVRHASEKPAGTGTNTDLQDLAAELDELNVDLDDDLSTRLERAVDRLAQEDPRDGEATQAFVGRMLRLNRLGPLRELVLRTIRDFDRVAVLIDNLDKTWEKGVDYSVMARFILALLTSIGRVEREFSKPPAGLSPARVTLSIFLRTDIYDAIARFAREPDKVGVLSVRWQDPELLVRVLEERYVANRSRKKNAAAFDMWGEVFDLEVRGLPTRDYFLWRTLSRPRDLIFFANASLTTAINRKHSRISAADVTFAEKQYSRFAIEALLVESDAEDFNLEEVLYEFAGLDSTLREEELSELLAASGDPISIRDWLVRTSFLGVEVRSGEFVHVEGETDSRRQVKVAERFASRQGSPVRYRIHPAFRPFLEVRDDDLHRGDLRDATLDPVEGASVSND
ncbi:hypothetical protein J2X03_003646 [Microbacterium trichothecenolyticum]|uniref:P-loop ATPase, Sll1717 family n=1 Tax=Microbacterium trichothecenolyticum TaxID=69370 RepID=UPI002856FAC5|nr:hypothetical protein [Microbacterium trichothecenolyticum]MDR7113746.1 hypothetical protein [Microbacterium trichothecenolyticum]